MNTAKPMTVSLPAPLRGMRVVHDGDTTTLVCSCDADYRCARCGGREERAITCDTCSSGTACTYDEDSEGWFCACCRQTALLRAIAVAISEDGHCHSGSVLGSPEDAARIGALERRGLLDTDLCSCCDRATAHTLTQAGLRWIGFARCARCRHLFDAEARDGACCSDDCANTMNDSKGESR